jgi:glycosyltransferase involved in cell wall biosynthesis
VSDRTRAETLVFVPAWNEEESLPGVLRELRAVLPEADVLVVDDGSADGTVEAARAAGAEVISFGENRGLTAAIAAGYAHARDGGYRWCGRVDADGQHPAEELRRLLELVQGGSCDVAVGSRFASGDGYEPYRYRGPRERELGQWLLRRLIRRALGRPLLDATSGLYAVNDRAIPLLAEPYEAGAPEVEGLIRLVDAGLRVEEVPAAMRERAGGESKLTGKKALMLVLTVAATVLLARRRRSRAATRADGLRGRAGRNQ